MAVTCFPIGVAYLLLSAGGFLAPLPRAIGMTAGVLMIGLSAFSLHQGRDRGSKRWVPWTYMALFALVSVCVATAGSAGVALLDTYVVLGLYGFYILRPRMATFTLAISCLAFIGFSALIAYPYAEIRTAVTVSVILVAAGIMVRVRGVTLRFVRKNRELSEVDAHTDVANLRALRLRVGSAINEFDDQCAGRPMLMTVDLDRFKLVNDRYNHTVGDQMLEAVARAISECVRIDEMVARRGGDEFFVMFGSTTPEHMEAVIPRVREAVSHARARICPDLTPTASVGYVQWQPGQSAEQFLTAADGVMHDEKIDARARDYSASASAGDQSAEVA